ncbi:MAG: phosphoribosylglycinamide formyltransferase [Ignavibacteriaceae bacterium]|nr:phosphoribosylglycinamide formyltransferase [Ignavibacteriaceae bacterium]
MNIAVFVSGRGSNLNAIIESEDLKNLISIKAVFSDKSDCPAFEIAKKNSIPTFSIGKTEGSLSSDKLFSKLIELEIDLIVLAGYLKLIPGEIVSKFKHRIINIHPALLPSFGGKGMYGMNVHKAVFEASSKVSGATVHFIDEEYDKGIIIAQKSVDISDVQSAEEIASKVLKIEHEILPFVIKKIAEGKVKVEGSRAVYT